jgi:hypothetical protein
MHLRIARVRRVLILLLLLLTASAGAVVNVLEKLEVMIQNAVVKTQELSGGSLQRYLGLTNRTAKAKYGPDIKASEINYFLPRKDADVSDEPSEFTKKKFQHFREDKYERFLSMGTLYGLPFSYDPALKDANKSEDLDTFYFGPGVHIELRLFLKSDFGKAIRALDENRPGITDAQRVALKARRPRLKIEQMWFGMERQSYQPTSGVLISLQSEFKSQGERVIPFSGWLT